MRTHRHKSIVPAVLYPVPALALALALAIAEPPFSTLLSLLSFPNSCW